MYLPIMAYRLRQAFPTVGFQLLNMISLTPVPLSFISEEHVSVEVIWWRMHLGTLSMQIVSLSAKVSLMDAGK